MGPTGQSPVIWSNDFDQSFGQMTGPPERPGGPRPTGRPSAARATAGGRRARGPVRVRLGGPVRVRLGVDGTVLIWISAAGPRAARLSGRGYDAVRDLGAAARPGGLARPELCVGRRRRVRVRVPCAHRPVCGLRRAGRRAAAAGALRGAAPEASVDSKARMAVRVDAWDKLGAELECPSPSRGS
jgi:hypothetical protein